MNTIHDYQVWCLNHHNMCCTTVLLSKLMCGPHTPSFKVSVIVILKFYTQKVSVSSYIQDPFQVV